jgi:hypothetical protein
VVDRAPKTSQVLSKLRSAFAHSHHPLAPAPVTPRTPTALEPDSGAAPELRPQSAPRQRLNRRSVSHKFSMSVKQTWKSKRNVSKRDRRKSIISGAAESTARIKATIRTGLKSMQLHRAATVEVFSAASSGSQKSPPQPLPQTSSKSFTFHPFGSGKRSAKSEKKVLPGIADAIPEEDDGVRGFVADGVLLTHSAPLSGGGESDRFGSERERRSQRPRSRNSAMDESLGTVVDSGKDGIAQSERYEGVPDIGLDRAPSGQLNMTEYNSAANSAKYTLHSAATKHPTEAVGRSDTGIVVSHQSFSSVLQGNLGADASFGITTESAAVEAESARSQPQIQLDAPSGSGREHNLHLPTTPAGGAGNPSAWVEEEGTIADVFFLSWPELYLEGVQSLIMIIALYYALYFTNFAADSTAQPGWKTLTLLPALLSSFLLIYITKCAVLLSALHAVDCDAILEVLEQTEGAKKLSGLIQEKIVARLREMGSEPQAELFELFAQIDLNGDGALR